MSDDLTKITANFTPPAVHALLSAAAVDGLSNTDTLNRAVIAWAQLVAERDAGNSLFVHQPDGSMRELRFT